MQIQPFWFEFACCMGGCEPFDWCVHRVDGVYFQPFRPLMGLKNHPSARLGRDLSGNATKTSAVKIVYRGANFVFAVHHKWAIADHWFIDGYA